VRSISFICNVYTIDPLSCFFFSAHLLLPVTGYTVNVMFDAKGTRILCREVKGHGPHHVVVYKVPSCEEQQRPDQIEKTELSSPRYTVPLLGHNICFFAADEDEFVVASAEVDHPLHIWSVLDGPPDQSLLSLGGHELGLKSVRCSTAASSLASCGDENVIKLWTPTGN
jgi:WD40 repeat protein